MNSVQDSLPSFALLSISGPQTRGQCNICFESFTDSSPENRSIHPLCGHRLHEKCYQRVKDFSKGPPRCPTCRDPLVFSTLSSELRRGESKFYWKLNRLREGWHLNTLDMDSLKSDVKKTLKELLPSFGIVPQENLLLSKPIKFEAGDTTMIEKLSHVQPLLSQIQTNEMYERVFFSFQTGSYFLSYNKTLGRIESNYNVSVILTWKGAAIFLVGVMYPPFVRTNELIQNLKSAQNSFMKFKADLSDFQNSIQTLFSYDYFPNLAVLAAISVLLRIDDDAASAVKPWTDLVFLHLQQVHQHNESGSVESYKFDPGNSNIDIERLNHAISLIGQLLEFVLMRSVQRLPAYRVFTANMNVHNGAA